MIETLTVDDLNFELRWSDRRRSIGITVDRGGELILHAPRDCPKAQIEAMAREKKLWIYTKLAEKEMLFRPVSPKRFVSGENHYYLGRTHRLRLYKPTKTDREHAPLRLVQGCFNLWRAERSRAGSLFFEWYVSHGKAWLTPRVKEYAERLEVQARSVEVLDLGFRWGSCGQGGRLNFHWRVMLLPPQIINYVVAHEVVHLREPHHDERFWQVLERVMPNYAERRQWLAENGAAY